MNAELDARRQRQHEGFSQWLCGEEIAPARAVQRCVFESCHCETRMDQNRYLC